MNWLIVITLTILWALGIISGKSMGGFIHILLISALIVATYNIIQRRKKNPDDPHP